MKDIAIYGAGGFGREIACAVKRFNVLRDDYWNFIGFFDDGITKGTRNEYGVVLGGLSELNSWGTPIDVLIAIGTSSVRKSISERINNLNVSFPNFLLDFRCADVNNYFIGQGNIVLNSSFSCNVKVGNFNVFNGSVALGHDAVLGSYNTLMPAVRISGEVHIGNENFFGVGAIILQGLSIGNRVRIGAGSVLMHRPKDGNLYVGNPAKVFKY